MSWKSSDRGGPGAALVDLVSAMRRLRASDGCPWDRQQTLESLRPYLVEETYEVLEALDGGDAGEHCEELGDLLFQIVFQAQIRTDRGDFDIDDVIGGIVDKLVRRHPHVFGDATADDAEEVARRWEAIKRSEKAERSGDAPHRVLDGIPRALPALARAQKLSSRAARVGFDWPDVAGCLAKVREEVDEVAAAWRHRDQAGPGRPSGVTGRPGADAAQDAVEAELGDLLFAAVSLSRKLGVDAEQALRRSSHKFTARFEAVEARLRERGRNPESSDLEEMDALWEEVKATEPGNR